MRIIYFDIDSLRPDHLGCYGYHRPTSPNIDRIAAQGTRFENCCVSDAPCLPSRTALWSGRFGIHTGVVNHGGVAAEPFVEGPARGFRSRLGLSSWMHCLREQGLRTVSISPFAERHSAWHWCANFSEIYNPGGRGWECADEVSPLALDWILRHGRSDNWFLHVNFWDPHQPYRTPAEFGEPFAHDPPPDWLTEEIRREHWQRPGPQSAQEVDEYGVPQPALPQGGPRQPRGYDSLAQVRRMFDGYDTGVRYADEHLGRILDALAKQNVLDDTVIIISADHGECLGELNIYGGHRLADHITTRVPLIIRWPKFGAGRVDHALHYQFDFAATIIELAGGQVPANWDGRSFVGAGTGRGHLVVSQAAIACQRAVRCDDWMAIRTYHDDYHGFPDWMVFDVKHDPHELHDLATERPDLVNRARTLLDTWQSEMMRTATHPVDPLQTVLAEGGSFHARGKLTDYMKRLRETGRAEWAERLGERR